MTNLQVPGLVSEEARLAREQRQQAAQSQLLQFAQLRMNAQRQQEVDEDRDFRAMMTIASDPNFPDEMRVSAINRLAPKLSLPGSITIEGLKPMTTLLDKMWKTRQEDGDLTIYQPAIEMIMANPRLVRPVQVPQAVELAQAVRGQRATAVTDMLTGVAPEVREAVERVKGREQAFSQSLTEAEQNQQLLSDPASQASPIARRGALSQLERHEVMQREQARDQAIIEGSTIRDQRTQRIQKLFQNNPKLLEQGEAFALQQAGFSPFDAEGRKMRIHLLQTKETLTTEETRELDSLSRLEYGKSILGELSRTNARMLDLRMQKDKAELAELQKMKDTDRAAMTAAEPFRTQLDTIIAGGKSAVTDEQIRDVAALTEVTTEAMGQATLAHVEAVKPQVQSLIEDRADLQRRADELHREAARRPSEQRTSMLDEERNARRLLEARDAQLDLLTQYHPLQGLEHEYQKRLREANVEEIEAQLKKENRADVRTQLEADLEAARGSVATETKALEDWTAGRNKALTSLEKARLGLERDSAALKAKLGSVQMQTQKEEATNLLATALVTDMAEGKSLSKALRDNATSFPQAETKDAVKIAQDAMKSDETSGIALAQDIFAGLMAKETEALTPERAAALASKAVSATQKQLGVRVKVDDVLKAMPTGKAVEGGGLIEIKRQQEMFNSVIQTSARLSGEQVGGISISQEAGGESHIQIGGTIKDPLKLGQEILQQVEIQSYLPESVRAPLRRLGERLVKGNAPTVPAALPTPAPEKANPLADFRKELGLPDGR